MDNDLASLLRPPRDPVPIPDPWAWVVPAAWGLIAILVLILVVLWWLRRARPLLTPPPPAVLARQRLASLPPTATPEEVAATAAAALRQYCAARFGLPATGRTSEELLAGLRDRPGLPPETASSLAAFLEARDLIAFAGPLASGADAAVLRDRAVAFIQAAEAALSTAANSSAPAAAT